MIPSIMEQLARGVVATPRKQAQIDERLETRREVVEWMMEHPDGVTTDQVSKKFKIHPTTVRLWMCSLREERRITSYKSRTREMWVVTHAEHRRIYSLVGEK